LDPIELLDSSDSDLSDGLPKTEDFAYALIKKDQDDSNSNDSDGSSSDNGDGDGSETVF
jgi:hypothetical protein